MGFCQEVVATTIARTLREGIELIQAYSPNVVIFDVSLPDGSGFDALEHIKENTTKTICISALPSEMLIEDVARYGVFRFLPKPFDITKFTDVMHETLLAIRQTQQGHILNEADEKYNAAVREEHKRFKEMLAKEGLLPLETTSAEPTEQGGEPSGEPIPTMTETAPPLLEIDVDGVSVSLEIPEVLYCEAQKNYVIFTVEGNEETVRTRATLSVYEALLEEHGFVRVHKSFLVQMRKALTIKRHELEFPEGRIVPIGERRFKDVRKAFERLKKQE